MNVEEGINALLKLLADISERIGEFRSQNENDCAFWLERTLWHEIHDLDSVRASNLLALTTALDRMNEFAASDQRDDLYRRIIAKVWDAASCDWRENPQGKRILRRPFTLWFSNIVAESLHPMKSKGKMQRKMIDARLPPDAIVTAFQQREMYRKEVLSPSYLNLKDRTLAEHEVLATLQHLVAKLDAGHLPNSGVQFHAECLNALKALQPTLPVEQKPPLSFLQGCMYAVADRCQHRFQRYS